MAKTTVGRAITAHAITLGQASEAFLLRCLVGFLAREQMIPENPFQFVEKPRVEKKLIKPMSMEQVGQLLGAIKTKRWTDHNLRTIMVLILDTGLRVSELIGIRRDALDLPGGVLRVPHWPWSSP